ncbi:MAG TPA: glycosyltransferase [Steroidobacteraceae bacterium]|nr:glycosyltransferase [Steroidobacteraceae bacterium]
MIRVNIIGKSNNVGLTRDIHILADALRTLDCEVNVSEMGSRDSRRRKSILQRILRRFATKKRTPKYDLNLMLEHVWTQFAADGRINVVVANPDFFDRHDVVAVRRMGKVWAKTVLTQRIFSQMGCLATYIGFDSIDRYDASCRREKIFFHLVGSSPLKGTDRLLEIWSRHPEWPSLVVVGRLKSTPPRATNVKIISEYLDDAQLLRLQNECAVHVCTSETESWGHYLVEGLSVGAVVITLSAPPMNELVTPERGILLACKPHGFQQLLQRYVFDEEALSAAVARIAAMSPQEFAKIGAAARRWYLENKAGFCERLRKALSELPL